MTVTTDSIISGTLVDVNSPIGITNTDTLCAGIGRYEGVESEDIYKKNYKAPKHIIKDGVKYKLVHPTKDRFV